MQNYFYNIDTFSIKNRTIMLDIDGTIVADGEEIVSENNVAVVNILSKHNYVFLCSNKNVQNRNEKISKQLNILLLNTPFKKPDKRIINFIGKGHPRELVVIGDKYITDGVFAKKVKADFIKIKRIKSGKESLNVKIINLLDDFVCLFIKW